MDYDFIKDSAELRRLIAENPDLPIAVLCGEDAASDDYSYTYCSSVTCSVDEILDCETPYDNNGIIESDRDNFYERMQDWLSDQPVYDNMTNDEFEAALKAEIAKYDKHWKKCICIWATN